MLPQESPHENKQNNRIEDWYQKNYSRLNGFGLWLRGGEINTLPPNQFYKKNLRVLFARLSTYEDTSSSFTHRLLYELATEVEDVFPDMAYLPPKSDVALFRKDQIPLLLGTQSKNPAEKFDVLALSNSITQELINLPTLFIESNIPLCSAERLQRHDLPLVILGGANSLYTSCLWNQDPWVDGIFIGESDQEIQNILRICNESKKKRLPKSQWLEALCKIDGFIRPDRLRPTQKQPIHDLNKMHALLRAPIPYTPSEENEIGSAPLQISEGCPCFCTFCAESWDRKPYREKNISTLIETAKKMKAYLGLHQIDLYSFNFNLHSDFYEIIWNLVPYFRFIGIKSQRFDQLAHDRAMAEIQHLIEKANFTCGMEGLSSRLRKYLHKSLSDEDLFQGFHAILNSRAREIKVFLIATGKEEKEDFLEYSQFLDQLKKTQAQCQSKARIIFSITPLVRFPWTPLEFENAEHPERYRQIIQQVKKRTQTAGFEFREAATASEALFSQILVRAIDPMISKALLAAVQKSGFIYYQNITDSFFQEFLSSLHEQGLSLDSLLQGHTLEEDSKIPWAQISTGVKRSFLWEQFQNSRLFQETDYCLGRNWTKTHCHQCGGCPTPTHIKNITQAKQSRHYPPQKLAERIKQFRSQEISIFFRVNAGNKCLGLPRKMLAVALSRALLLSEARLVEFYRGYTGSHWDEKGDPLWISGEDVLELKWLRPSLSIFESLHDQLPFLNQVEQHLGGSQHWGSLLSFTSTPSSKPLYQLKVQSPFQAKPEIYLRERELKHTLIKSTPTHFQYELIPAALKKGILRKLEFISNQDNSYTLQMNLGPKFNSYDFEAFAKKSFLLPDTSDWVRIQAIASAEHSVL